LFLKESDLLLSLMIWSNKLFLFNSYMSVCSALREYSSLFLWIRLMRSTAL
jgi:hypothetical protein